MFRRLSLVLALAAAVGIAIPAIADDAFGPQAGAPAAQAFTLGKLRLTALRDGGFVAANDGKVFGADVGPAAVGALLKGNGVADDRISLSVSALLVRNGKQTVLLDTGLGIPGKSALIASLKRVGVAPDAVTDIFITHAHGDHVGGLVDASGKSVFAKATIRFSEKEWASMQADGGKAALVKAIAPQVKTFVPGTEVIPGITPVALDGHTPGHVGYEIGTGKQRLLDIGDMVHSSIVSLQHPEWAMGFDSDGAAAKATRAAELARLAKSGELVFSPHFPFPGVGRIVRKGDGFGWKPGLR